jgi:hypothetical protein
MPYENISVLWVKQTASGSWLCYHSPPLVDEPILLCEAFTADNAATCGLERMLSLYKRDGKLDPVSTALKENLATCKNSNAILHRNNVALRAEIASLKAESKNG